MAEDLQGALLDRVLFLLLQNDIDISPLKDRLTILFNDYKIESKETALAVYTAGKNEIFLKRFLLAKAVSGCSKRTVEQYGAEISRFLKNCGKDADCITAEDIQVHLARLMAAGDSKSYCDTVRRYLSTFYGWLYRQELIKTNPMNRVDRIKYQREKKKAFSDLEVEQMRSACETNYERAMFETLLSTGCRASELVSIKLADIEGDAVQIFGKGGKWRTVYINAKAQVAITAYMAERKDKSPYLFPGAILVDGGKKKVQQLKGQWYKNPELVSLDQPLGSSTVNDVVKRIAKRAGVTGSHAHRFRRTCATNAMRRGMPIEQVQMMLGHAEMSTTQVYLDIQESDLHEAHKKYVV